MRKGPLKNDVKYWSVKEVRLLRPPLKVGSKIMRAILSGWNVVTGNLKYDVRDYLVPQSLSILHAYFLSLQSPSEFNLDHYNKIHLWTQNRAITNVADLWIEDKWVDTETLSSQSRSSRQIGRPQFQYLMLFLAASPGIVDITLEAAPGWYWLHPKAKLKKWELSARQWRELVPLPQFSFKQFNSHWSTNWSEEEWRKVWRQLWSSSVHPCTKVVAWRLLHFGYFTQTRGAMWKVCEALCPICKEADESTIHLFFSCSRVQLRWAQYFAILETTSFSLGNLGVPIEIIS
jgi:hypothetical protein